MLRRIAALAAVSLVAAAAAGCAQNPQRLAAGHGKEYFPSSTYGAASPRVIEDGQPIPRGGGQYLVGKPYTVAGQTYYPSEKRYSGVGLASWYGDAFHGRRTANGEIYDREAITAAHPTMPLPSFARVTNLRNNYSMIVRVNDRGPFHANRIMDVSHRVAQTLQFDRSGTGQVKVEYVGRADLNGSDDDILMATLSSSGPARLPGETPAVRVAETPTPRPMQREAQAERRPERVAVAEHRSERIASVERRNDHKDTSPALGLRRQLADDIAPPHAPAAPKGRAPGGDSMRLAALVQAAEYLKTPAAKGSATPAPKARPLDLATVPGAGVPIGARQRQAAR